MYTYHKLNRNCYWTTIVSDSTTFLQIYGAMMNSNKVAHDNIASLDDCAAICRDDATCNSATYSVAASVHADY